MKKIVKSALAIALSATFLQGCQSTQAPQTQSSDATPKNIIMIVADGMGPVYPSAYRYYNDNPDTDIVESTVFDRHLVGSAITYPASVSGYITDSAAGATALATATKSYNKAIGVDVHKQPVDSVLQFAKDKGMKTGVVVTSQVNHATPASYITHNESRLNYNDIADSYIDNGINVDVLLGGGTKYFIREDRNLVSEFKQAGFSYIDSYESLNATDKTQPLLGLFAPVGLPWALDDKKPNRLSLMTKTALAHLENKNGYFMLIEASQVDWAGHGNDVASAMAEMSDLASTLKMLEKYVESNPDTLVVLTADHSTGGMSIAANGEYKWDPSSIRKFERSVDSIGKAFLKKNLSLEELSSALHTQVTDEEYQAVIDAKSKALTRVNAYTLLSREEKKSKRKPNASYIINPAINAIVDRTTNTGWTSGGHTGIDVPVYSFGKGFEKFRGVQDNTEIADKIFKMLGK